MAEHDATQRVLAEMLTENTGSHFLDSGGAYGRAWEKNQGKTVDDFINSPEAWYTGYSCVSVNVFHWLYARVEYNGELDAEFSEFMESREDTYYLEDMESFSELKGGSDWDKQYLTGTFNTYNGEEALSQTLQFAMYEDSETDESIMLLQIHGGCDVRGGYTKPRAFTLTADDRAYMFDWCEFTYHCDPAPVEIVQTEQLFNMATPEPESHYFDIRNGEVTDWEGNYRTDIEIEDDEDNNPLCPECGAIMKVYANNYI